MTSPASSLPSRVSRLGRWLRTLATPALLGWCLATGTSAAQTLPVAKVAADLRAAVDASVTPSLSWAKDLGGVRYVKLLIVSNSSDPELTQLRAAVMAAGGSIYYRYSSVQALAALLPARQVAAIAARSDVQSLSPNRLMKRAASTLEAVTGTAQVRSTGGTSYGKSVGLTGAGVGIAVLDSGIAWQHAHFADDGKNKSRVREGVDFTKVGDAVRAGVSDWAPGVDVSATLYPGSASMSAYLGRIMSNAAARPDPNGHGTHVAAVAAGRGAYQAVDSTGIAPGANIWDVRVLNDDGYGQLSDVLAGIDWVIYYARWKNIRIVNLSLGTDSTESYLSAPEKPARSKGCKSLTTKT